MGMERNLSDIMKKEAISHGLCKQWTDEWGDGVGIDGLIDKFVRGIDFCIREDWPSVSQMKEFLPEANIHGVYIDQHGISVRNPHILILNGDCDGNVFVDEGVSTIWVRHTSRVYVRVRRGGCAFVRVLDESRVKIDCGFFSDCKAFVYSDRAKVDTGGSDIVGVWEKFGFYDKKV